MVRTSAVFVKAVCIALFALTRIAAASGGFTFTALDDPNSTPKDTYATGVYGNTVVGYYYDSRGSGNFYGFTESGGVYNTIANPVGFVETLPSGIDGSTVVGTYYYSFNAHTALAYIETEGSYAPLAPPGATWSQGVALSGNTVLLYCPAPPAPYGQTYSFYTVTGGVYTLLPADPLAAPGATYYSGISGNTAVGTYYKSGTGNFGFMETAGVFTTLSAPDASEGWGGTSVTAINGNSIVGSYADNSGHTHGFIDIGGIYTTFDDPAATSGTFPTGVWGNTVVGYYSDAAGTHGFIVTIPEPHSLSLLVMASVNILGQRRARRTVVHLGS